MDRGTEESKAAYRGFEGKIGKTIPESTPAWATRSVAGDRPNVIVVLCDDLGFSDLGCYGSEIDTPNLDALAVGGAQFSNFHAAPMCSPSRAALLTGMNPHEAGVGSLAGADHGFPGYRGQIAADVATAADVFRHNGYRTLMVGKWHLSHTEDHSDAGARANWPLQRGFDRFYGFMEAGLTNLHEPNMLHEDNHAVPTDQYASDYYFTDDITDRAIEMIHGVKGADPSTPFFLYLAHGAVHAPLMAKPEDIAKYRGRYDVGWDAIRERRFARQKELGLLPADAELPPRNGERGYESSPWDSHDAREREVFARHMEVYAAMVDNVDQNWGRLRDALVKLGELDNTIVLFSSDNGASREGGDRGTTEYYRTCESVHSFSGDREDTFEKDYSRLDLIGGPRVMAHYPWPWAEVSNTPFRLQKATTFQGGHHVACLVSWPGGEVKPGEIRRQFAHLSDVLPTFVDVIGLESPARRNGHRTRSMSGQSFGAVLKDPGAPPTNARKYCEMNGHRGYYDDDWEAVTLHYPGADFDEEHWYLFDLSRDPAQAHDLAEQYPERVEALKAAFDRAAWDNQVYPLADGMLGMYMLRAPAVSHDGGLTLFRETPTVERSTAARIIACRSFRIVAHLGHDAGADGIVVSHGDQGGGYLLYVDGDGKVAYAHNAYGDLTTLECGPLPSGDVEVEVEVDAVSMAEWDVRVLVDGEERGQSRLAALGVLAPFEGIDVGQTRRSPVDWELRERHGPYPYGGVIHSVRYLPGESILRAAQLVEQELATDTHFQ